MFGWILVVSACSENDPQSPDDTDDGGACGEITTHQLSVSGLVHTADGQTVAAADVRLEDRG